MTQPTQAQIEAAEDARLFGIGFIKQLPDGTQRLDPRTIFIDKKAALTAAAEVPGANVSDRRDGGRESPTPTQAQIEAAATVLMKLDCQCLDWQSLAKAALTAAHEAWLSETFSERWQAAKDRAAAAKADPALRDFIKDTPISEPNDGWAVEQNLLKVCLERIEATGKALEAQTIERCAQVAASYQGYGGGGYAHHSRTIAAAIRALKDKP